MYTLFARPASGSVVVEAILEEAGASYQVEMVERGADGQFPENFRKLNPLAQVPTLILPDDTIMTESGAITVYLSDRCQQLHLAPLPRDQQRANYLRWMFFLACNVYMTDLRIAYSSRFTTDPAGANAVKDAAAARMAEEWEIYAKALGDKPFMLGETLSAVDIYAAMLVTWNDDVPAFFAKHPNIKAMYDRVLERPAVAKIWARNGM